MLILNHLEVKAMLDLYVNIKKRREELGLTQSRLAELAGYADKTMISKIEKGTIDLPQSKIVLIAEALRTTPKELMGWSDDDESEGYYTNPDTAAKAQELFDNPNMRVLFDAAKDADPADLQMAADLLWRLKAKSLNLDNDEGC